MTDEAIKTENNNAMERQLTSEQKVKQRRIQMDKEDQPKECARALMTELGDLVDLGNSSDADVLRKAINAIQSLDSIGSYVEEEDRNCIYAVVTGQHQEHAETVGRLQGELESLRQMSKTILNATDWDTATPNQLATAAASALDVLTGIANEVEQGMDGNIFAAVRNRGLKIVELESRIENFDRNLEQALITSAEQAKQVLILKTQLATSEADGVEAWAKVEVWQSAFELLIDRVGV